MITKNSSICSYCGAEVKYYDTVKRIKKEKYGIKKHIYVQRFKCLECGMIHRQLPANLYPYKHYDSEIINGVIENLITPETLGYEDYPCEITMKRWISQHKQALL